MKYTSTLLFCLLVAATPSKAQNMEADLRILAGDEPSERARAACRLADLKEQARETIPALIALMGDDTPVPWDVCRGIGWRSRDRWYGNGMNCDKLGCDPTTPGRKAAAALARMGSLAVSDLELVLGRGVPHARRNAAWALGVIGDESAIEGLVRALTDDVADVRENAAWALGAIGDEAATEGLIRALKDDVADVRENVAWALGAIGDERAVEPLISVFENDDNNEVRRNAIWALRSIH